jgi:hypothetical protein
MDGLTTPNLPVSEREGGLKTPGDSSIHLHSQMKLMRVTSPVWLLPVPRAVGVVSQDG